MRTLNLTVAFTTANNIITLFPPKQCFWLLGESWGVMNEGNHSTAAHHAQKMLFQFQDQLRWIMREKSIPTIRDVPIRLRDRKLGPITWFQTRSESDVTSRSGLRYICIYILIIFNTSIVMRWHRVRPLDSTRKQQRVRHDITLLQRRYWLNAGVVPKSADYASPR